MGKREIETLHEKKVISNLSAKRHINLEQELEILLVMK